MQEIDIALSLVSFLTLREKYLVRNRLDSLSALSVLSIEELSTLVGRPVTRAFWDGRRLAHETARVCRLMQAMGIGAVRHDDGSYPALLREIRDAPYLLYWRGRIDALHERCVSVVGTRRVCRECAEAALDLSRDACDDGCTVVSGNASGIDSFAHKGALSSGSGATAAVLPCGIDTVVPPSNTMLARRILERGGVLVSEYAPGVPVEKWRFVQRNRIIAALSPVTVVVQAPPGSGALITAEFAADFDRELMFHRSCFCTEAGSAGGTGAGKKTHVRSAASFVDCGAPVIDNYADMVSELRAAPGTRTANLFPEVEYGSKGS